LEFMPHRFPRILSHLLNSPCTAGLRCPHVRGGSS
jgi:hypothetical protein